MIIAIPVDDKSKDTKVCISFGRAPYFMFYDTEAKKDEYLDNIANSQTGGAGITSAQNIVDKKADILLTIRCGENAAQVLEGGDVKIYKTKYEDAMKNIEAFENGDLEILGEIHPGFHNHK